jgi:hypothetical protein
MMCTRAVLIDTCVMQVLEEQALRMITWSGSLNNDYLNEQQHRMNQGTTAYCVVLLLSRHVLLLVLHTE